MQGFKIICTKCGREMRYPLNKKGSDVSDTTNNIKVTHLYDVTTIECLGCGNFVDIDV